MPTHSFPGHTDTEAGPYNLFKLGDSFASWASRIALPQSSSPNLGLYGRGVTVPSDGDWYVFRGDTQPTSWGEAVGVWSTPEAVTSGSGENAVPIRVHSDNVNIRGALVSVFSGSSLVAWGSTQTNGISILNLVAGNYTINVSASGFASQSNVAITVVPVSPIEVDLETSSVTPPSLPNTCRVRIKSMRASLSAQSRVLVTSSLQGRDNELAYFGVAFDGLTDNDGDLEIDLPWSSQPGVGRYRFRFIDPTNSAIVHDRTCTVPDLANADYGDLT